MNCSPTLPPTEIALRLLVEVPPPTPHADYFEVKPVVAILQQHILIVDNVVDDFVSGHRKSAKAKYPKLPLFDDSPAPPDQHQNRNRDDHVQRSRVAHQRRPRRQTRSGEPS